MDTLVAALLSLFSHKEPRFAGTIYRYQDPYTLESYPVIEGWGKINKNTGLFYWGGVDYGYLSFEFYKPFKNIDFSIGVNPINPDEYSQTVTLTITKTF